MPVITRDQARHTETPAGAMTTLASPTLGNAASALWRVRMAPHAAGPEHRIDVEQIWTVLDGGAEITLGTEKVTLAPGDTAVLPADVPRQITAGAWGLTAVATAPAGAQAYRAGETQGIVPPWTA
ncbi:cupin domain-containing protein [Nocardia asteroides]|uniref:cupin domain-containing protein n=1 Tax=Nocardia asteroides TaxID=1824 RepID=UPI001E3843D6|nr:cupin domain-containing protein [Nocardia asteroides]UGT60756.1 cupin domain-containing protein [Nocardia asteroides]